MTRINEHEKILGKRHIPQQPKVGPEICLGLRSVDQASIILWDDGQKPNPNHNRIHSIHVSWVVFKSPERITKGGRQHTCSVRKVLKPLYGELICLIRQLP